MVGTEQEEHPEGLVGRGVVRPQRGLRAVHGLCRPHPPVRSAAADAMQVGARRASGTATKILSTGYGELASHGDGAQLELRASWSPATTDLAPHIEAWSELICTLAGLPPTVEGVTLLASRRVGRD